MSPHQAKRRTFLLFRSGGIFSLSSLSSDSRNSSNMAYWITSWTGQRRGRGRKIATTSKQKKKKIGFVNKLSTAGGKNCIIRSNITKSMSRKVVYSQAGLWCEINRSQCGSMWMSNLYFLYDSRGRSNSTPHDFQLRWVINHCANGKSAPQSPLIG